MVLNQVNGSTSEVGDNEQKDIRGIDDEWFL